MLAIAGARGDTGDAAAGDAAAGDAAGDARRGGYLVPTAWLESWASDDTPPGPIVTRPLACAHGGLDPNVWQGVKCVSGAAWRAMAVSAAAGAGAEGVYGNLDLNVWRPVLPPVNSSTQLTPLKPTQSLQEQHGVDGPALGPGDLCLHCVAGELRGRADADSVEDLRAQALDMWAQVSGCCWQVCVVCVVLMSCGAGQRSGQPPAGAHIAARVDIG